MDRRISIQNSCTVTLPGGILVPLWIQDADRGAQAVTNGGVLEVRRSEAGRNTHLRRVPGRYALEGKVAS